MWRCSRASRNRADPMFATAWGVVIFARYETLPDVAGVSLLPCRSSGQGFLAGRLLDENSTCDRLHFATHRGIFRACSDCARVLACLVGGSQRRERVPIRSSFVEVPERADASDDTQPLVKLIRNTLEIPLYASAPSVVRESWGLQQTAFSFERDQVLRRLEDLLRLNAGWLFDIDPWLRWWAVRRRSVRGWPWLGPDIEVEHAAIVRSKAEQLLARLAALAPAEYRDQLAAGTL